MPWTGFITFLLLAAMPWSLFIAAIPALLIAWCAVVVIRNRAERWGLVAQPREDRFHKHATPTGGGIAIWLGVLLSFAGLQLVLQAMRSDSITVPFLDQHLGGLLQRSSQLWVLLSAATAMFVLGLMDDLRGLDWRLRIVIQTLIALFVVLQGWRLTLFIENPWVTGALSVVWIVGIVNSINLIDNMDGLAAGVTSIAGLILVAVMLLAPNPQSHQPQLFVAGFLIVLIGAIGGFWIHNRPPATIFLGDCGSYFIGFCLAMATLMATFAGGDLPQHAVFAPLCVLAVPIYDTVSVITIRLYQGRSPFEGDKNHFSHRLVQLGMTSRQAVGTIYLLTAACGLGALLLHQVNTWGAVVILLMVFTVLCVIAMLEGVARVGRTNH
jgi:UDP-GlcNAc:undecaprenyl-phosphate GlcNAc-1-phosphate transferase